MRERKGETLLPLLLVSPMSYFARISVLGQRRLMMQESVPFIPTFGHRKALRVVSSVPMEQRSSREAVLGEATNV